MQSRKKEEIFTTLPAFIFSPDVSCWRHDVWGIWEQPDAGCYTSWQIPQNQSLSSESEDMQENGGIPRKEKTNPILKMGSSQILL